MQKYNTFEIIPSAYTTLYLPKARKNKNFKSWFTLSWLYERAAVEWAHGDAIESGAASDWRSAIRAKDRRRYISERAAFSGPRL
jgi:hypothetical protein